MSKTSDMHVKLCESGEALCLECKDACEKQSMPFGLCEDCQADFNANDAEYQLAKALHYMDMQEDESSRDSDV